MLDERIARVKELIAQREELDAELAGLLGITERRPDAKARRCSKCGEAGHRATACPGAKAQVPAAPAD